MISHESLKRQKNLKAAGMLNLVIRALPNKIGSNKKYPRKLPDEIGKSNERFSYFSYTKWSKSRLRGLTEQVDAWIFLFFSSVYMPNKVADLMSNKANL